MIIGFCVFRKELAKEFNLSLWKQFKYFFTSYFSFHISTLGVLQECRRLSFANFMISFLENQIPFKGKNLSNDLKTSIFTYEKFRTEQSVKKMISSNKKAEEFLSIDNEIDIKQQNTKNLDFERFVVLKGKKSFDKIKNIFTFWDIEFSVFENQLSLLGIKELINFVVSEMKLTHSSKIKGKKIQLKKEQVKKSFFKIYKNKFSQMIRNYQNFLTSDEKNRKNISTILLDEELLKQPINYTPSPIFSVLLNNNLTNTYNQNKKIETSLEICLLDRVVSPQMRSNVDHLELELISHNHSALRFYKKLGFKKSMEKKEFYVLDEIGYDCIKLYKPI